MKNEKYCEFERQVNQDLFYYILGDFYKNLEGDSFENDTFIIRYYDWVNDNEKPNFEHKASGFKMYWYKYPLRSPEVNMNITHEQFSDILYDCKNSLYTFVKYVINEWWKESKGE